MAVSQKRIADLARAYATHRPLVQRGLMTGFVLYVFLASYKGIAARPSPKGKDLDNATSTSGREKKPPRVAVSVPD